VVHFEVAAVDDGPLVAFYRELFGWELRASPREDYTMIDTRGGRGINGGIGRSPTGSPWSTFYVETEDPQASLDHANALGGTTVIPVTNLGGAVTVALFSDPDGLLIGLVQARTEPFPGDRSPSAGSGEPVTWFEILGSDPARSQRFYAELFGWTIDTSGVPGYAVANTGTRRGIQGGVGGGEESRWAIVCAGVADVEETLRRAEKLGGSRLSAPGVSTLKTAARAALYGSGDDIDTGWFRDPAGNVFGVSQKKAR
jgi:predicted enzyme related to lactoylglutathione lyase